MSRRSPLRRSSADRVTVPALPVELRLLQWLLVSSVFLLPLLISPTGLDTFREPKEYFLCAMAALSAALVASLVMANRHNVWAYLAPHRTLLLLLAGILLWLILSALASAFPGPAVSAVVRSFWFASVVVAIFIVAHFSSLPLAVATIAAGVVNSAVLMMQLGEFHPFPVLEHDTHLGETALLGNPNDVGMTLVPAAIAAFTLALTSTGRLRTMATAAGITLGIAVVSSQTVTAIVALLAGSVTLLHQRWSRKTISVVAIGVIATILLFALTPPLRDRVRSGADAVRERRLNDLTSSRLVPFLAAWEMFKKHPFIGVGPGSFAPAYFEYKMIVDERYKELMPEPMQAWSPGRRSNFGEAHSDWLQTAAETGLPGLLLLTFAVYYVGRKRLAGPVDFGSMLARPLTVSFSVLALAQFPLRLAAPSLAYLTLAAIVLARREDRS